MVALLICPRGNGSHQAAFESFSAEEDVVVLVKKQASSPFETEQNVPLPAFTTIRAHFVVLRRRQNIFSTLSRCCCCCDDDGDLNSWNETFFENRRRFDFFCEQRDEEDDEEDDRRKQQQQFAPLEEIWCMLFFVGGDPFSLFSSRARSVVVVVVV